MEISPEDPCPCGQDRPARTCCLVIDHVRGATGRIERRARVLVPKADTWKGRGRTGHETPGCYAAHLRDCQGALEGEHIASKSVLEPLADRNGMVTVGGLVPGAPEKTFRKSVAGVVANVLCARHNRALGPVDEVGKRFFGAIDGVRDRLSREARGYLAVCGYDVERWMLKWLAGFYAAQRRDVPKLWINVLFGRASLGPPQGLYVYVLPGEDVPFDGSLQMRTARGDDPSVMLDLGCAVQFRGFEFVLSLDPRKAITRREHVGKLRVERPGGLRFRKADRSAEFGLFMTWDDDRVHPAVEIDVNA